MVETILITVLIVAACVALLGVRILFIKGGKFPNTHISGSKAMRERGITCVQSQDREARQKHRFSFTDVEKSLNDTMN